MAYGFPEEPRRLQHGNPAKKARRLPPMDFTQRITINPAILAGKPIIRNTRISVELVLEQLGQGWSIDDILAGYPHLEREDVLACIQYAHRLVESEQVYPAP